MHRTYYIMLLLCIFYLGFATWVNEFVTAVTVTVSRGTMKARF